MSVYSEAWANLSPAVRTFYVNFAALATAFEGIAYYDTGIGKWLPFTTFVQSFPVYTGFAIAQRNWTIQRMETGSFDPERVILRDVGTWGKTYLQPPKDFFDFEAYELQWDVVPDFCFPFPREKHRVRRSYWTGAPRKRRNL